MPTALFQLDPASGMPFYRQVQDQVLAAIGTGALRPGDQLPTVRALSVELSINPNTVARAYKELEIRGVLTTQQGIGTFVSNKEVRRDDVNRVRLLQRLLDELLARAAREGFGVQEILVALRERSEEVDRRI